MRNLKKQTLLRLSGGLFMAAAVAFWFSPLRWMAALDAGVSVLMFALSVREGRKAGQGGSR